MNERTPLHLPPGIPAPHHAAGGGRVPDSLGRRAQQRHGAFEDARTSYIDVLLELIAFRTRLVLGGAASLVVRHPTFDHDGPGMDLIAVRDGSGAVLADVVGDDGDSVLTAEKVADDLGGLLGQIAMCGFRPDRGGVIELPAPADADGGRSVPTAGSGLPSGAEETAAGSGDPAPPDHTTTLGEAVDAYGCAAAALEPLLVAAIAERVLRTHGTAAMIEVAWSTDGGSRHPYLDVVAVYDAGGTALPVDDEDGEDMLWDIASHVRLLGDVQPDLRLRDASRVALDPAARDR